MEGLEQFDAERDRTRCESTGREWPKQADGRDNLIDHLRLVNTLTWMASEAEEGM